jgi:hypothetical protein
MILITIVFMTIILREMLVSSEIMGDIANGTTLVLGVNFQHVRNLAASSIEGLFALSLTSGFIVSLFCIINPKLRAVAIFITSGMAISCLFGLWYESRIFLFTVPAVTALLCLAWEDNKKIERACDVEATIAGR